MHSSARTKAALLALLIAAAAIVAALARCSGDRDAPQPPYENYRVPAEQPPVEPDRPDLFEELGSPDEQP